MKYAYYNVSWLIGLMVLGFSCKQNSKEILSQETYEGAIIEMDSINLQYSDSARLKVILKAPKQLIDEDDNRDFPDGVQMQFFDVHERLSSTLRADKGYFFSKDNMYKAEGNVVMKNLRTGDELSTEELFWEPQEEIIKTQKFVTIKTEGEIHTGEGLTASDDFETYKILKPSGTLTLDDDF